MSGFTDDMTLGEARDELRELVRGGHVCPCCRRYAKVYRRTVHTRMARDLIRFYKRCGLEWGYAPEVLGINGGDFAKLRWWGLIEGQEGEREDGSKRVGWWRVTGLGQLFVRGEVSVPRWAKGYAAQLLRLEGTERSIVDCLGKKFDYAELMAA